MNPDPNVPAGNPVIPQNPVLPPIIHNAVNPPTIATLNKHNLEPWLLAIKCATETLGIARHVANIDYQYDSNGHRSVTALTSELLASLPTDVAAAAIIPGTPINPCLIINRVTKLLETKTSAAHDALELEATATSMSDFDSSSDYFDAHSKIRTKMISARYPSIDDEKTTIKFLIKGMTSHPTYA